MCDKPVKRKPCLHELPFDGQRTASSLLRVVPDPKQSEDPVPRMKADGPSHTDVLQLNFSMDSDAEGERRRP